MITMKAITLALEYQIPFAAYLLPGEPLESLKHIIDIPGRDATSPDAFIINSWNTPSAENVKIRNTISREKFLDLSSHELEEIGKNIFHNPPLPHPTSTTREDYNRQVATIIDDLRHETSHAKTVLSRVICGNVSTDSSSAMYWTEVARRYFALHRDTFRYIYYTPSTGAWMGASPELLLQVDKGTQQATTMALAGTRDASAQGQWDSKNTHEQEAVVMFIINMLEELGLHASVDIVSNLKFGDIAHRCNHITFDTKGYNIDLLLDRLNPTPALSGYPRMQAIARIKSLEQHPRRCYGGYVALDTPSCFKAYVNLRCINFNRTSYCMYAGGGITAHSHPSAEWDETVKKIASLHALL